MKEPIAIAGATGFVGRELIAALRGNRKLLALGRGVQSSRPESGVEWRQADFFSVDSLSEALRGSRTAIYLIHSMMPTARLDQSRFEDADLWLADTFARAAARVGVQRIVYLGGLIPDTDRISLHLRSRKETEGALGSSGVPVFSLRAGLVLGAQGSSFQILYLLVKRLPWMLCPRWAWTRMQPISSADVVRLLEFCIDNDEIKPGSYDIGGPDISTYRELMLGCAELQGLRRRMFHAPFFNPGLSTLWVCLVTGASRRLVAPLVQSMSHSIVVKNRRLLESFGKPLESTQQALARCIEQAVPQLRGETRKRRKARGQEPDVRSIQRLEPPASWSAHQIASEYFRWLSTRLSPWIQVEEQSSGAVEFRLRIFGLRWVLLELRRRLAACSSEVESFDIVDGWLVKSSHSNLVGNGTFEFRVSVAASYALVGLHGFRPRLPWVIYKLTQANAHQLIMHAFARWLASQKASTRTVRPAGDGDQN